MAIDFELERQARMATQKTQAAQQQSEQANQDSERRLRKQFESSEMLQLTELPFLNDEARAALKGLIRSNLRAARSPESIIRSWKTAPEPLFRSRRSVERGFRLSLERGWFVKLGIVTYSDREGYQATRPGYAMITPDCKVGSICAPGLADLSVSAYNESVKSLAIVSHTLIENSYAQTRLDQLISAPYPLNGYASASDVVIDFVIDDLARHNVPWVEPA